MGQIVLNYMKAMYQVPVSVETVAQVGELIQRVPQLSLCLQSPLVDRAQKRRVIDQVFEPQAKGFLTALCENGDMDILIDLLQLYPSFCREQDGVLKAVLTYVTSPDEEQLQGIKDYVKAQFCAEQVQISMVQDDSLLDGFILTVGDKEIDWSLKGRLSRMKQQLMRR